MSSDTPTTCPMPNTELIRQDLAKAGAKTGGEELATALQNIVKTLNAYIIRKGP